MGVCPSDARIDVAVLRRLPGRGRVAGLDAEEVAGSPARGQGADGEDPRDHTPPRAMGQAATFADALVGRFSFVPRLQTLLDQAGFDWSASQTLMNLSGAAVLSALGLWSLGKGWFAALGCGGAVFVLPFCGSTSAARAE